MSIVLLAINNILWSTSFNIAYFYAQLSTCLEDWSIWLPLYNWINLQNSYDGQFEWIQYWIINLVKSINQKSIIRDSYLHHLSYCVGQVEYDMQELKVMVRSMIGYLSTKMHLFKKSFIFSIIYIIDSSIIYYN